MIEKKQLEELLNQGKSTRKIAEELGCGRTTVSTYIHKYGLADKMKHSKPKESIKLEKIKIKEEAYFLGFLLGDGYIDPKNTVEITVNLRDKEVLEFISNILGCNINIDNRLNKKAKIFPIARISRRINDITKFTGGYLKKERHYPRLNKNLEKYLIQGFFDADGCITFGYRKDRKRIWQKVSFTSQYKVLEGVQTFLLNNLEIATKVRPKTGEDCYILEFTNREHVLKFLDYLYEDNDMIVLKRKYNKYKALRLELEEFGER